MLFLFSVNFPLKQSSFHLLEVESRSANNDGEGGGGWQRPLGCAQECLTDGKKGIIEKLILYFYVYQ